jgi:hypothetical protein
MRQIRKAYHYLFYKLYKWIGEDNLWGDWKAELSIDILSIFIGISFLTYYTIYFDRYFRIGDGKFFLIGYVLFIAIPNYFIFHHNNQWIDIVKEFDKLPKLRNKIGGWLIFGVVLLIIANMVFAFYQMSLIDWAKYR